MKDRRGALLKWHGTLLTKLHLKLYEKGNPAYLDNNCRGTGFSTFAHTHLYCTNFVFCLNDRRGGQKDRYILLL